MFKLLDRILGRTHTHRLHPVDGPAFNITYNSTDRDKSIGTAALVAERRGIKIAGINFDSDSLESTNFATSRLRGCTFHDAYLTNVCFADADLREVYFGFGQHLRGANFTGAATRGATILLRDSDGSRGLTATLKPYNAWNCIANLGSRNDSLIAFRTETHGLVVRTGCFDFAPVAEFLQAVVETHGEETTLTKEYCEAVSLLMNWADRMASEEF